MLYVYKHAMCLTASIDGIVTRISFPRAVGGQVRLGEVVRLDGRRGEIDVPLDLLPGIRLGDDNVTNGGFSVAGWHDGGLAGGAYTTLCELWLPI